MNFLCKSNISEMADSLVHHGSKNFSCKNCYYTTSRDSQYKRHLLTRKHIETYERLTKSSIHISTDAEYTCVCGKSYNHRQSLHKHKQKCNPLGKENIINNMCHPTFSQSDNHMSEQADTISNLTNLVTTMMEELAKQSAEAQRKNAIIEKLCDKVGNNTINNIHNVNNISNNVNYNINLFLNDKCKDAMNITEFVKNIHCQIQDLEYMGKEGYVAE